MLDENLPSFTFKPSVDNELHSTVFQSANGSEPQPEYVLRRPDPKIPAAKNCYATGLYDPFNTEVLYAEILVHPEWSQPNLSAAEVRALNGVPAPPTPVVPNSFAIQLYNPDQQVVVKKAEKSWGASSSWEFFLPQSTFRVPSVSTIDRSQNDPTVSDLTPKVAFRWKRDNKFSKDITCYMSGKTTDTKKTKEPDITVAMFRAGKEVTIYEPNLHRVDVEDKKGMEVVLLLGAQAIKDLYISPPRDVFNLSSQTIGRKNSMSLIGRSTTGAMAAVPTSSRRKNSNPVPASQIIPSRRPDANSNPNPRPPPTDPRTQWQHDAEAEALRAALEAEEAREQKAREKQVKEDERLLKKMLDAEEKERRRKEMEDAKETERLRKVYGISGTTPALPPRHPKSPVLSAPPSESISNSTNSSGGPQMPQYSTPPFQRPMSTPSFAPPPRPIPQQNNGLLACPRINNFLGNTILSGPGGHSSRPHRYGSGPYSHAPGSSGINLASVSTFFNGSTAERKKLSRQRSLHF